MFCVVLKMHLKDTASLTDATLGAQRGWIGMEWNGLDWIGSDLICTLFLNIVTDWYNEPPGRWIEKFQLQLHLHLHLVSSSL